MEHLGAQEVDEFLGALIEHERRLLAHLIDCAPCREVAVPLLQRDRILRFHRSAAYGQLWQRLHVRLQEALPVAAAEAVAAPQLLAELLVHSQAERVELIQRNHAFQSIPLFEAVLQRSYELVARDPHEAESLALLPVCLLQRAEHAAMPSLLESELGTRAWCLAGDARRRQGDLAGAEVAFAEAAEWLALTDNRLAQAAFCACLAALRRDQGRIQEAHALGDRALYLFNTTTEPGELGEGVEEQAHLHVALSRLDEAITAAAKAFRVAEDRLDAASAVEARYSWARCLAARGDFAEALAVVRDCRRAYPEIPPDLRRRVEELGMRLRWRASGASSAPAQGGLFELLLVARERLTAPGGPW